MTQSDGPGYDDDDEQEWLPAPHRRVAEPDTGPLDLRAMADEALIRVGGVEYLSLVAMRDPKTFLAFLGRVTPSPAPAPAPAAEKPTTLHSTDVTAAVIAALDRKHRDRK